MQISDLWTIPLAWLTANAGAMLLAAVVLIAGWWISRFVYFGISRWLPRAYGVDKNFTPLLAQTARYGIMIFSIVTSLSIIGVASASIYAVLGAAGLAIALALQGTLANIAAGIMLIWQRPIAIGEYVVGDGVAGVVVEIGLFGTRLRSTSGLFIFTPNQKLWSSAITNHSREPRRRIDVNITVPETANMGNVRRAMLQVVQNDKRVLPDPAPTVHVDSFTGDKVVLQLRAWVPTPQYQQALRDTTERTKAQVNKVLAGGGEQAEVSLGTDPHTQNPAERTPDLS